MKRLIAVLTALVLMFAFTACGSSESAEKEAISYVGEWEYVCATDRPENVDDLLNQELTNDDLSEVLTLNEDGTYKYTSTSFGTELEITGIWEETEDGIITHEDAEPGQEWDMNYRVTSDGSLLVYYPSEEMVEVSGDIVNVYRRK